MRASRPASPSDGPEEEWRESRAADGTPLAWRLQRPQGELQGELQGQPQGRVPVILLNGIACSDVYWPPLCASLETVRPVLRTDYRGHGRSGVPADPQAVDVATLVADLDVVRDAAGLDRAVLVGHSFGVQVALETASRHPQRVAGVVAVAGAGGHPLSATAERVRRAATLLAQRRPDVARRWWERLWDTEGIYWASRALGGTSHLAPREVMQRYFRHVHDMDLPTLAGMFARMQEHDATDVASTLDVGLLAIAGGRDRLTPVAAMRDLVLRAPDADLVVVSEAAHTLPAERPEAVRTALEPFLSRIDLQERQVPVARIAG